ncbi:MAG: hypothetical protein RJB32_279 [Actinomycetota bacterium]
MAPHNLPLDHTLEPEAQAFVADNFESALEVLSDLVAIPGIAWPAFDPQQLEISAKTVAALFEELDFFDWVKVTRSNKPNGEAGSPAVLARRSAKNGKPHVLLYAHHDVQPPGEESLWETPPFTATRVGDRLFGRGASDDKSGIVTHLYAIKTLQQLSSDPDLGVTLFIEGEEEAGSESFDSFLEDNLEELQADLIIVADSGNWTEDTAALTTSLRGVVSQTFTVKTLDHAVHSGMFGGPLPDATTVMIKLLATLVDDQGNVAVAGLHSVPVADLPYDLETFRKQAGLLDGVSPMGSKSLLQHTWGEPAVTVIGLDTPAVATSSNTAQPQVSARVSLRIAPGEDPIYALGRLREHLEKNVLFGAKIEFGHAEQGPGYLAREGWASKAAHEIFSRVWPNPSVNFGIGGSIPFIATFAERFPEAQILVTGVEEPDSRAHSPNESQHLPTLHRAMVSEALLLLHGNRLGK